MENWSTSVGWLFLCEVSQTKLPKLFFAVFLLFCYLCKLFSFLFGNFVSSYDASLWLYLKFRGQDNSPTHHFLRERVEPRQETQDRALCPVPPVLALPPTTFPCVGFLLPWKTRKTERIRASLMSSLSQPWFIILILLGCVLSCALCVYWCMYVCVDVYMCVYVCESTT